jgi:glycosyltransferase involved in cell wall biosynthesis
MRVVHLAPTAFGREGIYGGGERYPLELARAVAAHVECTLVTFGRTPAVTDEAGGLHVRTVPALGYLRGHPAHPIAPRLAGELAGFDLVHTHQVWAFPSRVATVAARLRRQPVAVTDHGLLGTRPLPVTHRLVDRFLTVSRHSAEVLGVPPAKTTVIYGGVDVDRFSPGSGSRRNRGGVLFVGRLTPHKGVDRLLKAVPPGARLTLVGTSGHDPDPPESEYPGLLRKLAEGLDVRCASAVNDEQLVELYRGAAALVLPSVEVTCYGKPVGISELLGLSVLEAMACGTPVVASRLGGLREVVHDGETGFLVTPGDENQLRDRLARLLEDPALARRMGENARQLAVEQFTWDACARRCLEAYEEMLARGGRRQTAAQ